MILGLTGTNGSGKGTVAERLIDKGWSHFSAGGLITEEIYRRGLPINRDNMIIVGNDLRQKNGSGYIIEELIRRASVSGGDSIVESIRTIGEVEKLKQVGGILLAIDADQRTRFERIKLRGSLKDGIDFKKFAEQEKIEMESNDPTKQNLSACRLRADYTIENNGTIDELGEKMEEILKIIKNND
jgi:dephospho-CoA kinase